MVYRKFLLLSGLVSAGAFAQTPLDRSAEIDRIFSQWSDSTPGCAVGVRTGALEITKAYGLSDLEHGIRNSPDTVFEAGSVSKQFTAMAVLLLAQDGKLSLDDQARKYLPELPDYGQPVTIREMLAHTSGLRDWGEIAAIEGWPRSTRVYEDADVLNIMARQKELNFAPGTRWSYNNTGYTLSEIIVSRVSGMSLAEFTRQRIFVPLGMNHTSWRDDYTRIVPNRAVAYVRKGESFHADMPFENVYGHAGLLTTIGDLLKWNEHLASPDLKSAPVIDSQQQPNRLADGRLTGYGFGVFVRRYQGIAEISHTGSTAGYTAYLGRYPQQQVSIAALCNVADINTWEMGHAIADVFIAAAPASRKPKPFHLASAVQARLLGTYRNNLTQAPAKITAQADGLYFNHSIMHPLTATTFIVDERKIVFSAAGFVLSDELGAVDRFERAVAADLSADDLAALAGRYSSPEIEGEVAVLANGHSITLQFGTKSTANLDPAYGHAFSNDRLTAIFSANENGKPRVLTLSSDRVWNLRLSRIDP